MVVSIRAEAMTHVVSYRLQDASSGGGDETHAASVSELDTLIEI